MALTVNTRRQVLARDLRRFCRSYNCFQEMENFKLEYITNQDIVSREVLILAIWFSQVDYIWRSCNYRQPQNQIFAPIFANQHESEWIQIRTEYLMFILECLSYKLDGRFSQLNLIQTSEGRCCDRRKPRMDITDDSLIQTKGIV